MDCVASILLRLGLAQYMQVFKDNHIDYAAFQQLSDGDLSALGLRIGDKVKIKSEITRIRSKGFRGK